MESLYPSDHVAAAVAAACEAARQLGIDDRAPAVLHQSNNVVVRIGDIVLKVGGRFERLRRDVALAAHAARNEGPVIPPLGDAVQLGNFVVSAWPYRAPDAVPATAATAARALAALHSSLADTREPLPPLADRFADVRALLEDPTATAALATDGRRVLLAAIDALRGDVESTEIVLHGEPHDDNRLTSGGAVLYFDLESACRGPLEWDLAYLEEPTANRFWPDHDRPLCRRLRIAVGACVSTFCWRHVTARPGDDEMRWHAEHHLATVAIASKPRG